MLSSTTLITAGFLIAGIFSAPAPVTFSLFVLAVTIMLVEVTSEGLRSAIKRTLHTIQASPWLAAFFAYSIVSCLLSVGELRICRMEEWYEDRACWHWYIAVSAMAAAVILVVFAFERFGTERNSEQNAISALFIAVTAYLIYSIATYSILGFQGGEDGRFRLSYGIVNQGNPNNIMNFVVPLAAGALCVTLHASGPRYWLAVATVVAGFVIIGLTYSYGGVLGAVTACVLLAAIVRTRQGTRHAMLAAACLLLGFELAHTVLSVETTLKTSTAMARLRIWAEFVSLWLQNPIFGSGMGTDVSVITQSATGGLIRYHYAHSVFLHTLVQGGLLGLALFVAAGVELLSKALSLAKKAVVFPILYMGFVLPILLTQKGPVFFVPGATWVLVWGPVLTTLIAWKRYFDAKPEQKTNR